MSDPLQGRAARIAATVRDLFNDSLGGFLSDEFIVRSINRCIEDIAVDGYWRAESPLVCNPDAHPFNLNMFIDGFIKLHGVAHESSGSDLVRIANQKEFDRLIRSLPPSGPPEFYFVQHGTLSLCPRPSAVMSCTLNVRYSYKPADVTGSEPGEVFPVPEAHDAAVAYFVLRNAFLRDRHAPGADTKFQEYAMLYEMAKRRLLGCDTQGLRLGAYRR